jgi:hypothetical protein
MAKNLAIISRELFYFLSALLLAFIILEIIWPNIILSYLNLNYLFILTALAGSIYLIKK